MFKGDLQSDSMTAEFSLKRKTNKQLLKLAKSYLVTKLKQSKEHLEYLGKSNATSTVISVYGYTLLFWNMQLWFMTNKLLCLPCTVSKSRFNADDNSQDRVNTFEFKSMTKLMHHVKAIRESIALSYKACPYIWVHDQRVLLQCLCNPTASNIS